MRPSPRLHVLVDLREKLSLRQQEMAVVLGMSTEKLKNLELTRTKLTKDKAEAISDVLGVDASWLMANDRSVPPPTAWREEFTKEAFERYRKAEDQPVDEYLLWTTVNDLLDAYISLRAIFASASLRGMANWNRAHTRLRETIGALREEFGTVRVVQPEHESTQIRHSYFTPAMLSLMEHDLEAAREVFAYMKIRMKAPPTRESMAKYRANREKRGM